MKHEAEHGTTARYRHLKCRCEDCKLAHRRYKKMWQLKAFRGEPTSDRLPTDLIVAHVRKLVSDGTPIWAIAFSADVPYPTVYKLHRDPPARMDKENAARILAVRPIVSARSRGIDVTGTRRRLEALQWKGWSRRSIAKGAGVSFGLVEDILCGRKETIFASKARAIEVFYRANWNNDDTAISDKHRKGIKTKSVERGFMSPGAWDDETIDDPYMQPDVGLEPRIMQLFPDMQLMVLVQLECLQGDRAAQLRWLAKHEATVASTSAYLGLSSGRVRALCRQQGVRLKPLPTGRPRKESAA